MRRGSKPPHFLSARWAIIGLITVAGVVAYWNSFRVPFLLDDIRSVARNRTLSDFATAFHPPENTSLSGRPLANASFALNRALSGEAVWSYHALNLLIHLAAAWLLFGVVRRTLLRLGGETTATAWAGASTLLWALHPLQTEAVTYVVQRTESLMALLYLLTLYGFIRATTASRPAGWSILSVAACGLGMAAKEVMVSAPFVVLLYDRTFVARSFRAALARRRLYYAALAATWLVLALCVGAGHGRASGGILPAISPWSYLVTQGHAIVHYLRLALWPAGQVFDYGYRTVPLHGAVSIELAAVAAVFLAGLWSVLVRHERQANSLPTRRECLGFVVIVFFAVLAPSSSIVPIPTETIAEHRMYLPLATVLIVSVIGLARLLGRHATIGFAAVALGLGMATFERNAVLQSPVQLWSDVTSKEPGNARGWANLGHALADAGRWQDAITACRRQLQVDPRYTLDADAVIGRCLLELHQPEDALPHLLAGLRQNPDAFDLHNNAGMALAALNRLPAAVQQYEAALTLNPDSPDAHGNLANALVRLGRAGEAWPHYAAAATGRPHDPQPELNWAASLAEVGDAKAAAAHFHHALALDPGSAAAHIGLGDIAARSGNLALAVTEYETALRIDPQDPGSEHNLAVTLMQLGKPLEALAHFRATVRLLPKSAQAHVELASAFAETGDIAAARQECEAALRLDPGFEPAREILSSLPSK